MDVDQRNNNSTVDFDNADFSDAGENISYPATNVIRGMIRELLTLSDYSIARISNEIGISTATVRRLLQGNTLHPSVRTFDKVIRLYCSVCHRIYANQQDDDLALKR